MRDFSIQESIKFGWKKFWDRPWFFVGVYLIIGIFSINFDNLSNDPNFHPSAGLVLILSLITLALAAVGTVVRMGEKKILLKSYENTTSATFGDLWTPHPFWRFFLANIVVGLIVGLGIILLIVPGIIFAIRYMFVPFIVIEKGLRPFEALRESRRITNGHKWRLFLFSLVLVGINILGTLCLLIGLLVTVPVTMLATVYVYRLLEHRAK